MSPRVITLHNHYDNYNYMVMIIILHYHISQDNLVELKHHKLVRSIRSGTVSRDLKPNAKTRDQLNVSSSLIVRQGKSLWFSVVSVHWLWSKSTVCVFSKLLAIHPPKCWHQKKKIWFGSSGSTSPIRKRYVWWMIKNDIGIDYDVCKVNCWKNWHTPVHFGQSQALTKFLKCVDWNQPQEAKQVCIL